MHKKGGIRVARREIRKETKRREVWWQGKAKLNVVLLYVSGVGSCAFLVLFLASF